MLTDSDSGDAQEASMEKPDATPERDQSDEAAGQTGESDGTGSYVYECPGCEEVYLNEEPHRCSNCGKTTVPVASNE
jgi:hypothetical protein